MRFQIGIFLIIVLLLVSFFTCDIDKGLDIIPWIEGKIFIKSIDRVAEGQTGDIIVVVSPEFPPKKWTDIIKTPTLNFNRNVKRDTITYKVPLNNRTYDVVAVLWKPKGEEWSFETISNILGVYTAPNLFKPKAVTITNKDHFIPDVNITADFGLVRYGAFIKGKITYKGDFNPRTDMLILAAFPMKPETVVDYLFALGWDFLPKYESAYNPYEFNLDVKPGYSKYIALFWKGEDGSPYDFRKIADLEFPDDVDQSDEFSPEGTYIRRNSTLESFVNDQGDTVNVELVADFDITYD